VFIPPIALIYRRLRVRPRLFAVKPQAGDGDLHSGPSSGNGETSEEMLSPSMRLAVIIKIP
jgi:hypothetical protein